MSFENQSLVLLKEALAELQTGFDDLPEFDNHVDVERIRSVLLELADKLKDNFPYQHPLYAGQMLKPPHSVARLAYALCQFINPNNHALDGGRATSALEKEAVANIARMFGYSDHLGHLCGGGTMANLEALWVASKCHPRKTIVASEQAHYTHARISSVLELPFQSVPCDAHFKMDVDALREILKRVDVGTVVVTTGTTATGSVDPLEDILKLQEEFKFRIHIDAAYGGYFTLARNLKPETLRTFELIHRADSIVVDPHKHGLQPYGCGCVLFRDPSVGAYYKHDSPYTYFSSDELHLGEISLECSRAGSSAGALWATQQMFPLEAGGEFACSIERSRSAAQALFRVLDASERFFLPLNPDLDILIYAPKAATASAVSELSRKIFQIAASKNLHLALANLPRELLQDSMPIKWDAESVQVLRSCLLKPEHLDWVDQIAQILVECSDLVAAPVV